MAGGALLLVLSRLIFARPKPSPLDPYFKQLQQERAAAAAEQQRTAAAAQQRNQRSAMPMPDPKVGKQLQGRQ